MRNFIYGYVAYNYLTGTFSFIPEEWRPIKGYEGLYEVSNMGRVRSKQRPILMKNKKTRVQRGQPMKHFISSTGYFAVRLSNQGGCRNKLIHRLVAEAFICNPYNKPQVNHLDGDKQNPIINNLEWSTPEENMRHAYNYGLMNLPMGEGHCWHNVFGGMHPAAKSVIDTVSGHIYPSLRDAARSVGMNYSTLACKLNGSRGNDTTLMYSDQWHDAQDKTFGPNSYLFKRI
ncbi:MAG TPA: NUMOD4 domain-containing protein [Verrucomicrobiae bacterium]|nr:NUMOD4 domain-containing protein [Verrucomicrobiae bacterium]